MKPDDIGKAYDQITEMWCPENFNMNNGIEQHKKAISLCNKVGRALDIGCGRTGRFIDLLLEHGYLPEGIDISEEKIALAHKKHPSITFYHQDICSWDFPIKYDFITAWDSIWHIPLTEQKRVITKIVNNLNSGGVFILSFGGTEEPGEHSNRAMGPEVYYSSLGVNGFLSLFIELGCICKHLEYDQYPELHAYAISEKL
ncbi:class I SAM-dependent methyltransferase [Shewanella sp. OPT22]|nr:class I SAM-dependent methyltransferase [Shewanella sp. OPT22]